MTHGPETLQDERTVEAPTVSHETGFDLRLLWLWPILLLKVIFDAFAGDAARLKALRRKTLKVPAEDWAARVEDLHTCEWLIRAMLLQQAERLLSGQEIDLYRTSILPPPEDWRPSEPRGIAALVQRFEVIARIQADPVCFIRRLARRLARARRLAGQGSTTTIPTTTIFSRCPIPTILSAALVRGEPHPAQPIRGPPRTGLIPPHPAPPNPRGLPARTRAYV